MLKYQLIVLTLILIGSSYQGDSSGPFALQPHNQTVNYGEFVKFECRSRDGYNILQLYLGDTRVNTNNVLTSLTTREIFADVSDCHCSANETIGALWILVNNKTIPLITSFWCRAFGYHHHAISNKGYIHVVYPECTFTQQNSDSAFTIEPTLTFHTLLASTLSPTFKSLEFPRDPCTSNKFYDYSGIVIGFSIGIILLIIFLLLTVILFLWRCVHTKRSRTKFARSSTNQVCNNMVDNPIYDGPVYESVQPHDRFDSLISQVAAETNTLTTKCSGDNDFEVCATHDHDNANHYVRQFNLVEGGSSSINFKLSPPNQPLTDKQFTASLTEHKDNGLEHQNKEDAYTLMNPAGTLTLSTLSGGKEQHASL